MGDERSLRGLAGEVLNSLDGSKQIQVVNLNFEEEKESTFDSSVEQAWSIYGGLDAFVNCYSYEGMVLVWYQFLRFREDREIKHNVFSALVRGRDVKDVVKTYFSPVFILNRQNFTGPMHDCLDISEGEYKKTIRINVMAPWFLLKAVAKRMRDNSDSNPNSIAGWGSIVFLTQILGAEMYKLPEGCKKAYVLKFDESSEMYKLPEKNGEGSKEEELIVTGKECCREFISRFLAAIPLREELEIEKKGPEAATVGAPHQRLQIEFHFATLSEKSSSNLDTKVQLLDAQGDLVNL